MDETWKNVPCLPEYEASSHGRIRRRQWRREGVRGGNRSYGGHAWNGCWDGARFIVQYRGKTYKVHRLVCEAFHGPAPFDGAVAMHLDEDARNNRPENLAWGSQRENLAAPGYRARLAQRTVGVKAAHDREQIILRRRAGEKAAVIAREYGVAPCTISNLTRGAL